MAPSISVRCSLATSRSIRVLSSLVPGSQPSPLRSPTGKPETPSVGWGSGGSRSAVLRCKDCLAVEFSFDCGTSALEGDQRRSR